MPAGGAAGTRPTDVTACPRANPVVGLEREADLRDLWKAESTGVGDLGGDDALAGVTWG